MCGENLVSIICLEVFSASLWNLYSSGTFQKAFLKNETGQGKERLLGSRDKVLVVHGIDLSSLNRAEDSFQMPLTWDRSLAWLLSFTLPVSQLLFSTNGQTQTVNFFCRFEGGIWVLCPYAPQGLITTCLNRTLCFYGVVRKLIVSHGT